MRQRKGRSLLQAVKEKKGSSRCPGRRASNLGLNLSGALCKNPQLQGPKFFGVRQPHARQEPANGRGDTSVQF